METVVHSFSYCLDFLREQVADVGPEEMVSQPQGVKNHPAWVIGHLTFSCQALGSEVGLPAWLPTSWKQQFGTGSQPKADAELYPSKNDALAQLADAESKIRTTVIQLDDAQLNQPLPDEKWRVILPTVRHAVTQILVAHTANHIGQMTTWRAAMGLPPLTRPFA